MKIAVSREIRALAISGVSTIFALLFVFGFARQVRGTYARTSAYVPEVQEQFGGVVTYSKSDVDRGRRLFAQSCSHCHSDDASGDEGPDLRGLQISDRLIARTVARGIKGEMPSFRKKHGENDVRALIAFLRSLPAGSE